MPVYLDDHFPEHPKAIAAGGDAAWLFVAALCFARRTKTLGVVPREIVPRLTDRRSPMRLAARLVEVGLFEPHPDGFVIHDYAERNWSEVRARNAANARWGNDAQAADKHHAQPGGKQDARPPNEHSASGPPSIMQNGEQAHARSDAHARAGARGPYPLSTYSSSTTSSGGASEPDPTPDDDDRLRQTIDLLAERRIARLARPPDNPKGYRRSVVADVTSEHGDRLGALVESLPYATPEHLADMLEPRAATAVAALSDVLSHECERCTAGWVEGDDGAVERCPNAVAVGS